LVDGGHRFERIGVARRGVGARRKVAEQAAEVVVHARQEVEAADERELVEQRIELGAQDARDARVGLQVGERRPGVGAGADLLGQERGAVGLAAGIFAVLERVAVTLEGRVPLLDELGAEALEADEALGRGSRLRFGRLGQQ
jgi:hypothetical protein